MAGIRAIATVSLCLVLGLARAQDGGPPEADPPDRAARLSYIAGDVSMQPAGEDAWAPALLNRPLTTGDKIWTEPGARAEIEVGQAVIRLDSDTGFSFLNVDDQAIQMRITAGVMNVRVRDLLGDEQIEIDTPNVALTLLRPGRYRVEVNDAGDATVVKIGAGEAQATGPGQNVLVQEQQAVTFSGIDQLAAQFGALGPPDDFDSWNEGRDWLDDRAARSRTAEYVSPDVTGYQDLDDNGSWSSEAEYGYVWTPTHLAIGWAPYQFGRWVWVGPWGWTWIDDSPWGYAPFHYGRWAHVRNRWCWVPGPRHARAVYAPALVGWVGSPGAAVGWFPLGPREVYVPARRFSRHYVERVNFSNTLIVDRTHLGDAYEHRGRNFHYRNRGVPGAVTLVSRNTFASAGRVGNHRVRVDDRELDTAAVSAAAPQIAPERAARPGGAGRVNTRTPPQALVNRQVVVKRDPPPSAARFARRAPDRPAQSRVMSDQVRADRPPRTARPAALPPPAAPASTVEQRGADGRPRSGWTRAEPPRVARQREDRPRDDRPPRLAQEQQQQRVRQFREQTAELQQARAVQPERREVQREQPVRERPQRQQEFQRPVEPRRVQQPVRNVDRVRMERTGDSGGAVRSAPQRPAETRSQPQRDSQGHRPQRR